MKDVQCGTNGKEKMQQSANSKFPQKMAIKMVCICGTVKLTAASVNEITTQQSKEAEESLAESHRRSQFQIIMTFHSLLCHRLGNALRVSSFELARQQVAEPSFQQRSHSTHEEQPHAPPGSPESTARTFADWTLNRQITAFTSH